MPVGTSDGKSYEDDADYWHQQLFGPPPSNEEPKNNLFLVRHGDTADNEEDLVHGWVNTPLNDKGIEQAHKAAESLKDKEVTRIISSDLPRAKQTANIIAQKLGVPVEFRPELRTWNTGDFDGTKEHDEVKKYTRASERRNENGVLVDEEGNSINPKFDHESEFPEEDYRNHPEMLPGLVDKYGQIRIWPNYEYYDKGSDSNKLDSRTLDWLNKNPLPEGIERKDMNEFGPGHRYNSIILRKKNFNAKTS